MTGAQMELLDAADQICRRFNASVTSWWRSPRHNAGLPGSVTNSQHMNGLAVDLVFDGVTPSRAELAPFLSRTMQDVRSEPGHVHLEQDPKLLARFQRPAVATGPASATSKPSGSVPPSQSTLSYSSSEPGSSIAPGAVAAYPRMRLTATAGPGSSPIDPLFKRRA
jgi:hypothetical protein